MQLLLIALGVLGIVADLIAVFITRPNFGTIVQAVVGITLLMWGLLYRSVSESPIRWLLAFLCIVPAGIAAIMWATALIKCRTARARIDFDRVDAVIVLGYATRKGSVHATLRNRLEKAIRFLDGNKSAFAILSGGTGIGEERSEAVIMRDYLLRRGADAGRLLIEDGSHNTVENAMYSVRLANARIGDAPTLVFITSSYHVARVERETNRLGLHIPCIGVRGAWYTAFGDYVREFFALVQGSPRPSN